MTPDFVLSLFFEGIRLHRRTAEGPALVGEVPLDSPDLARDLHALREAGIATGTPWTGTRLLLPPEQVRVLDLEGERDEAGIRAALEGVTPYPVGDLVIDCELRDGRTHVAAVARETLDEAEAFAAEHGFLPVSFAAPLPGFPREAEFGPTRFAASVSGAAPEPAPVVAPISERPPPPPASEPLQSEAQPAETTTESLPDAPTEPALPPPATAPVEPPPSPSAEAPATESDAFKPPASEPALPSEPATPPTASPPAEPSPTPEPPAVAPSAAEPHAAERQPSSDPGPRLAATPPTPPEAPAPASSVPLAAPGALEPIFASRAQPLRADRREGARPPAADTPRKTEPKRVEPSVRKPFTPPVAQGWALSAATAAARPDPRMPPRPTAAPPSAPPQPAAISAAVAEARRPAAPLAAPKDLARPAVLATAAATAEPERRGPFGRGIAAPGRSRGRPRYLGLILTVLLLIAMAAVALWASTTEQGLAGLFRRDDPPVAIAAAPPPEPPAPEAVASVEPDASTAPDAEDAAAAAAAVASAMADLPRAADAPAVALDSAQDSDPADPLATATAMLPEGAGDAVSPAEADRFYAATGVWLRPPRLSLAPEAEAPALDAPPSPATTTSMSPSELPVLAAASPDARPEIQAPGPATAEAAPDAPAPAGSGWVNAMAEAPGRFPPERPEAPEGFAAAPQDAPPAQASEWVNAMAEPPGALPPGRPDAPAEFLTALAAQSGPTQPGPTRPGPTQPGALAFAETPSPGGVGLAGLRPATRPESLAPPGDEPAPTVLASFDGPRPGPRPEGLAPEVEIESPDVSDALAEALAASETPEAPAAPDLQSTLAAIVAGAPDPLAGATRQAVAVTRVPDARPRNFDRVVQRQSERVARASQAPTASGGVGTSGLTAQEQAEAAGEAEAASGAAAAPSGVTPTSVAQAATVADAMRMRDLNLIGVYGQPNARRALIRLANGRYVRVGVGDQFDGGQVTAIGDNALNYVRRGRTYQLVIPGG